MSRLIDEAQDLLICLHIRHPDVAAVAGRGKLDSLCLDQIARFKRPRVYIFLSERPKNNSGNVLKTELRTRLQEETKT